jgi:uncharacterized protein (DUF952 family)
MAIIYHITRRTDWKKAQAEGRYTADTLHSQGFIHCSTSRQVIPVANSLFRGNGDLVLLSINESLVRPEIRYENLESGDKLFPHLYGPLNLDAIVRVMDLIPKQDGTFDLPREVEEPTQGKAKNN